MRCALGHGCASTKRASSGPARGSPIRPRASADRARTTASESAREATRRSTAAASPTSPRANAAIWRTSGSWSFMSSIRVGTRARSPIRPAASAARRRTLRSGSRRSRSSSPSPGDRESSSASTRDSFSMRRGRRGRNGLRGGEESGRRRREQSRGGERRRREPGKTDIGESITAAQATATRSRPSAIPRRAASARIRVAGPRLSDRGEVEGAAPRRPRPRRPPPERPVDPLPDLPRVDLHEGHDRDARAPGGRAPSPCRSGPAPQTTTGRPAARGPREERLELQLVEALAARSAGRVG